MKVQWVLIEAETKKSIMVGEVFDFPIEEGMKRIEDRRIHGDYTDEEPIGFLNIGR